MILCGLFTVSHSFQITHNNLIIKDIVDIKIMIRYNIEELTKN